QLKQQQFDVKGLIKAGGDLLTSAQEQGRFLKEVASGVTKDLKNLVQSGATRAKGLAFEGWLKAIELTSGSPKRTQGSGLDLAERIKDQVRLLSETARGISGDIARGTRGLRRRIGQSTQGLRARFSDFVSDRWLDSLALRERAKNIGLRSKAGGALAEAWMRWVGKEFGQQTIAQTLRDASRVVPEQLKRESRLLREVGTGVAKDLKKAGQRGGKVVKESITELRYQGLRFKDYLSERSLTNVLGDLSNRASEQVQLLQEVSKGISQDFARKIDSARRSINVGLRDAKYRSLQLWNNRDQAGRAIRNAATDLGNRIRQQEQLLKDVAKGVSGDLQRKAKGIPQNIKRVGRSAISKVKGLKLKDTAVKLARYGLGLAGLNYIHLQDRDQQMSPLTKTGLTLGVGALSVGPEALKATRATSRLGGKLYRSTQSWFNRRIASPVVNQLQKAGNKGLKPARQLSERFMMKGLWQTGLDVLSPIFDIGMMGLGAKKLLSLDENSTKAQYQQATAEFIKSKNALVGSIVGNVFGDLGDGLLSVLGQWQTNPDWEQVKLWQESETSGTTILARELRQMPQQVQAGVGIAGIFKNASSKTIGRFAKEKGIQQALKLYQNAKDSQQTGEALRYLEAVQGKQFVYQDKFNRSWLSAQGHQRLQNLGRSTRLGRIFNDAVGKAHMAVVHGKQHLASEAAKRYEQVFGKKPVAQRGDDLVKYLDESAQASSGLLRNIFRAGEGVAKPASKVTRGAGQATRAVSEIVKGAKGTAEAVRHTAKGAQYSRAAKLGRAVGGARHVLGPAGTAIDIGLFASGVHKAVTASGSEQERNA
ncbi:MAG: hypothetical protein ABEK59_02125, partial [Halobacteria archaeon]